MKIAEQPQSRQEDRRIATWTYVGAFLVLWLLYLLLHSNETVTDTLMASTLIPNIAQGYGIDLSHAQLGIDLLKEQPNYYYKLPQHGVIGIYPIGMILLAAPLQGMLWLLAYWMGLEVSILSPHFEETRFVLEKISASFLVAMSGVYVYRSLKLVVQSRYILPLTLVYMLGSGSLSLLAQGLWQQTGLNFITVLMLYFLLAPRRYISRLQEVTFFVAVGFLVSIRPTATVWSMFFAVSFYRLYGRPSWRAAVAMCAGVLPALVWNLLLFGDLVGGYAITPVPTFDGNPIECVYRLWLILSGGHKGLLVLHPILVGVVFSVCAVRACDSRTRMIVCLLVVTMLCNLVVCSTNPSWHGGRGFGSRYMLDGLGAAFVLAAIGIAHVSTYLPRATAVVVGIASVYSVVVHVFGAIGSRLHEPWLVQLHQRMLLP